MGNRSLNGAKKAKQDEFYTCLTDIEREIVSYLDYNKNVFRGKTVLLPCDDPIASNFTQYFALRFKGLGLKKLITTSYAPIYRRGENYVPAQEIVKNSHYDKDKELTHGKVFVLDGRDVNSDGIVNIKDVTWDYLDGDGDFRSEEVTVLRDEADMVITNPPFSLFREFVTWLGEGEVDFSIIGNINAITYREVFPLIKENKAWIGASGMRSMTYEVPDVGELSRSQYRRGDKRFQKLGNTCWYGNIEHSVRHEPLELLSMEDNKRFNSRVANNANSYKKYDNCDAIEVPVTSGIPSDYDGVMGVPISFMDKYCPEQFEIVGAENAPIVDGKRIYKRVLIRHLPSEVHEVETLPTLPPQKAEMAVG